LTVWACAILPEHVHMVVGRHTCKAEQVVNLLKGAATRQLMAEGLHPFAGHKGEAGRMPCCWARRCWKVFLNTSDAIRNAIRYAENNPIKEGKPPQRWTCVTPFHSAFV